MRLGGNNRSDPKRCFHTVHTYPCPFFQVHQQRLDKDELMFKAFRHFDTDRSGFITQDELRSAMAYQGLKVWGLKGVDGCGPQRFHHPAGWAVQRSIS